MNILDIMAEAERGPTPEQISNAPRIDGWWIADLGGYLRARGDLSGHPDITDPFVTTSPIFGFDAAAGWMRTYSRFYRLGQPLVLEGLILVDAVPLDLAQRILAEARAEGRAIVNAEAKGWGQVHGER